VADHDFHTCDCRNVLPTENYEGKPISVDRACATAIRQIRAQEKTSCWWTPATRCRHGPQLFSDGQVMVKGLIAAQRRAGLEHH